MMAQSIGSVISGTTYPSDDPEMLAVEADYAAREAQLQEEIDNIESSHPGYDEYRYDLGMIGHDPHELAAFLSAVLQGYTRQSAQAELALSLIHIYSRDAIIRHCRYVVKRDAPHPQSPDRKISMTFIPEGDLYRLIVHSKLPSAEQFEQWVFDEVLPTIRKHGAYLTREKLWEVATSPEALMKLCSDLLAEREANISLRKENAQLEGKAAFYDLFIDLKHSTNLRTTAKELDVPERRFVRFLIERRFVYRTASGNVLPYANVKNTGLFCVKDYCNHGHTGSYTLVTPKGKLYFAQLREMILLVS